MFLHFADTSQNADGKLQGESTSASRPQKRDVKIVKGKREVYVKCVKLEDENLKHMLKNLKLSTDKMNLLMRAQNALRDSSNRQGNKNLIDGKSESSSKSDANQLQTDPDTYEEKTNVAEENPPQLLTPTLLTDETSVAGVDVFQEYPDLLMSRSPTDETNVAGDDLSQEYPDLLTSRSPTDETDVAGEYLLQYNLNLDAINDDVPSSTTNELNQMDVFSADDVGIQNDDELEFSECNPNVVNSEYVVDCSNSDVEHKPSKSDDEMTNVSRNISDPKEAEVVTNLYGETPYVADSNNIDCVADTTVLFMAEQVARVVSEDRLEIVTVDPNHGDLEVGENCEIIQETQNAVEEKVVDSQRGNSIFCAKRGRRRRKIDDVKSGCSGAVNNGRPDADAIYEFRDEERDLEELSKISKLVQTSVKTAKYRKHGKKNSHKRHPRELKVLSGSRSTGQVKGDVEMDFIVENSNIELTNVDDNLKPNLSNISKLKKSLDGVNLKGRKRKLL